MFNIQFHAETGINKEIEDNDFASFLLAANPKD